MPSATDIPLATASFTFSSGRDELRHQSEGFVEEALRYDDDTFRWSRRRRRRPDRVRKQPVTSDETHRLGPGHLQY